MTAPAPALRWSHVALNCADQRTTEEFYRRWFGFQRARVVPLGDQEIIFLRQGSVYLELFASPEPAPITSTGDGPPHVGIARHVAFQTDDLAAFLDRIGTEVPVSLGPLRFDDFIPGWRSIWLTDPDGVVVEVSQGYRDQDPASLAAAHRHGRMPQRDAH
ncbi:VOC family protein [Micromonospora sp. NPDC006766]|uniref:VOC family protein n=1 Tax=Micromonospora sp. NPDC006766 TaxID=3154778 RepID=UPI0033C00E72